MMLHRFIPSTHFFALRRTGFVRSPDAPKGIFVLGLKPTRIGLLKLTIKRVT